MKIISGIICALIIINANVQAEETATTEETAKEETAIYDACVIPETPPIPGGSVTEEQLNGALETVKHYQIELNKFRDCLDDLKIPIDEGKMDKELIKKNIIFNLEIDSIYNISVDREQAVVDQLNSQIRLFKSKNEYKDDNYTPE